MRLRDLLRASAAALASHLERLRPRPTAAATARRCTRRWRPWRSTARQPREGAARAARRAARQRPPARSPSEDASAWAAARSSAAPSARSCSARRATWSDACWCTRAAVPVPGVWQVLPSTSATSSATGCCTTPERPFPCHVCGKGFITLSNLSRHLKLHRGHGLAGGRACAPPSTSLPAGNSGLRAREPRDHEGELPLALQSQARAQEGALAGGQGTTQHSHGPLSWWAARPQPRGPGSRGRLLTSRPLDHVLSTPKSVGL